MHHGVELTSTDYQSIGETRDHAHRHAEGGQAIPGARRHHGKAHVQGKPPADELRQRRNAALRIDGET
jgi:hypothetical protein